MPKDPMDDALDKEIIKNNIHRIMAENAQVISKHMEWNTAVYQSIVYNHGVMTGAQADKFFKMLMHSNILQVKKLPDPPK